MRVGWTTTVTLEAKGPRAADDAWERYAVPARWPEWSPQIRSVDSSAPRLAVGVTGVVHPLVGPGLAFEVTEYDEAARTWSWRVQLPVAGSLVLHHVVTSTPAGSATELTCTGPAPVVLAYAPLAQLALHRLVR